MFYIQYCELLGLQVKWNCVWMTDAPRGGSYVGAEADSTPEFTRKEVITWLLTTEAR